MGTSTPLNGQSTFLKFYKYLPVLTAEQISKLGQIAIGIKDVSAFSDEEIHVLEVKLQLVNETRQRPR